VNNVKKVGLLLVLAVATFVAQAAAQAGTGGADMLSSEGIFETEHGAFSMAGNTNVDQVKIGNDVAVSAGLAIFPMFKEGPSLAENNFEIKKNQDSGSSCKECCLKNNMETIFAGSRTAIASGWAVAKNNVKIVTNQA
jgi:hypothetical protein